MHRCLQRHGISHLPEVEGNKPSKEKFHSSPIGFFHVDVAELHSAKGKLCLFVAIDRTSKFAFVQLGERANMATASSFLKALIEAVPYQIHTVLTGNGMRVRRLAEEPNRPGSEVPRPPFQPRLLQARHRAPAHQAQPSLIIPWTNGEVERMNRTIKDATVSRYRYDNHEQMRTHLHDFIAAYNFARRLKTLKGLTPYEFPCNIFLAEPARFTLDLIQQMPEPYT